jgi:hypothetical protein
MPLSSLAASTGHWPAMVAIALISGGLSGCAPKPIAGGTPGLLTTDGNSIPDVQVALYAVGSGERLGYGMTSSDGSFQLVAADSRGPLELKPGSYAVTLESVGAPTELSRIYTDPQSTPLRVDWSGGDRLELHVPGLTLK